MDKSLERKRIWIFLISTFVLTYLVELLVMPRALGSASLGTQLTSLIMLLPAVCAIATRLLTREGMRDVWLRPQFKGRFRYYIYIWLGVPALIVAGGIVYFLIFPGKFDINHGYLMESWVAGAVQPSVELVRANLITQAVLAFILAPVLNFFPCLGEELGWRGYLLQKLMTQFKAVPAVLLTGVIWGVWHTPLIVMGHNYGVEYAGWPVLGVLLMVLFCVAFGVIFAYASLKVRSCMPAVLAHTLVNGFGALMLAFLPSASANVTLLGPAPTGLIAMLPVIVIAALLILKLYKDDKAGKPIVPPLVIKGAVVEPSAPQASAEPQRAQAPDDSFPTLDAEPAPSDDRFPALDNEPAKIDAETMPAVEAESADGADENTDAPKPDAEA